MPLPKYMPVEWDKATKEERDAFKEAAMADDSEQSVRNTLRSIKENPASLRSWEWPISFDEACRQYGV